MIVGNQEVKKLPLLFATSKLEIEGKLTNYPPENPSENPDFNLYLI